MEDEITEDEEKNRRRVNAFYKEKLIVHVITKKDSFYNGRILKVDKDFFVINDRKKGAKVLFYLELKNPVVEYEEVGG